MKHKINLTIALGLLLLTMLGCSDATSEPTIKNNNSAVETKESIAKVKMSTPSESNESLFNAIKNKDKTAVKQLMSRSSLALLEAGAKERKMTLDEVLDKQFFVNVTLPAKLEQRNEKINGDTATVEMHSDTGEWTSTKFVKEDGAWKASLQ